MANPKEYPWLFPPPGFEPIDKNGSLAIGGAGTTVLARLLLNTGQEGWIVLAGIIGSDYTKVTFQIRRGNAAIRDYERITVPLGQPDLAVPVLIKLNANEPIDLVAIVTAGAVGVRWRLFGWYYDMRK